MYDEPSASKATRSRRDSAARDASGSLRFSKSHHAATAVPTNAPARTKRRTGGSRRLRTHSGTCAWLAARSASTPCRHGSASGSTFHGP